MRHILLAIGECLFVSFSLNAQYAAGKQAGSIIESVDEVLDCNPSSVAVSNDHQSVRWPQPYLERWRILTDLNGDGVDDLILSETKDTFGNAGGVWLVYVCSNGYWRCIGDVDLYPSSTAFAFDAVGNEVDLWHYGHVSCCEGYVGYYTFDRAGMKKGDNRIFLRGGQDENDVYNRLCKGVFGYANRHPYRLEASETSTNGVVSWMAVENWRKPGLRNKLYELEQKLSETKKRANAAEARVQHMSRKLHEYEFGVHRLCGVTLGSAWDGGETNRPCEEVFSGFTNMMVSVDGNNFVKAIRLTRKDACVGAAARSIRGGYEPTDEEQKIIHQVENLFNVRFQPWDGKGAYSWGGPMVGTRIYIHFASPKETQSYVEIRYSRRFDE